MKECQNVNRENKIIHEFKGSMILWLLIRNSGSVYILFALRGNYFKGIVCAERGDKWEMGRSDHLKHSLYYVFCLRIICRGLSLVAVLRIFHLSLQISLHPSHLLCALGAFLVTWIALTGLSHPLNLVAFCQSHQWEIKGQRRDRLAHLFTQLPLCQVTWGWLFPLPKVTVPGTLSLSSAPWVVIIILLASLGLGLTGNGWNIGFL